MNSYYYTFGTDERYPYQGGWIQVFAETMKEANQLFRKYYPDRHEGILNCAMVYEQEEFPRSMLINGNLGWYCHRALGTYDEDVFFEENGNVLWMYYNPDSVSGGQFVINCISESDIEKAGAYEEAESFFDRLGEIATQYLVDIGTDHFEDVKRKFHQKPDHIGRTQETKDWLMGEGSGH